MAIIVDKELICTERQTLGGLRTVHEMKNIHGSVDVQQYYVNGAPQKHECLSSVIMTDAAATSTVLEAAYPAEKIGSEIKELICTAGVVTGAARWLKTSNTATSAWTKL